ncbi:unnamed protein product, partial [Ectocarpus sp. 13 AM-2016]
VNRTAIPLTLDTAQSRWVPVEQLGPLKINSIRHPRCITLAMPPRSEHSRCNVYIGGGDTGAGMVVFDPPITLATVVPDSKPSLNQ